MASTSHDFQLGLAAIADVEHAAVPEVSSRRALEISSGWRFVTLALPVGRSRKRDGCWFKSEGSPDWQRVEKQKHIWRAMSPLLESQGFVRVDAETSPKA